MSDENAPDRWAAERTTFQRVYDVVRTTTEYLTAGEIAERADCSDAGARQALDQLEEMGVAEQRDGRPATYRRNEAYLTWRRIESLAKEYAPAELRDRITALIDEDEAFQETFDVPDPDAVTAADLPTDDPERLEARWEDLGEWRTVRRDVSVLRRALQRAESGSNEPVQA